MPLGNAANGRVARHLRDQVDIHRDQGRMQARAAHRHAPPRIRHGRHLLRQRHTSSAWGNIRYSSWRTSILKILIVGGGGREHALAWRLRQSPNVKALWASPGNPGIAQLATCIPAPVGVAGYADLAEALGAEFTVVGPEAPLVAGIVDEFRRRGLRIFGPTQAAARLEGSKIFAKQFFERAGIPTARSAQVSSVSEALSSLKNFSFPVVIKADGLAAGKGVVVALDSRRGGSRHSEARSPSGNRGVSGRRRSQLHRRSAMAICSSRSYPRKTTSACFDGDQGPNTGGMGAYADARISQNRNPASLSTKSCCQRWPGCAKREHRSLGSFTQA